MKKACTQPQRMGQIHAYVFAEKQEKASIDLLMSMNALLLQYSVTSFALRVVFCRNVLKNTL